ncbi:MAG: SRPBCC family protein, partial [Dehalococcoidia bacterium]
MDINRQAPAIASGQVHVAATPETVWRVMSDIGRWPEWNPDIKTVSLERPVEPGTRFRWKSGPSTITSILRQVEPPRALAWTGSTMGIKAVHVWRLEPQDGGTRVTTEESWEGLIVRLLCGPMRKTLQKAIDSGLQHLKAEAERRAA